MNERTLAALKGSIEKWEKIVAGEGVDAGFRNCPLCNLFAEDDDCFGCPVANRTGQSSCGGSPYGDWAELFARPTWAEPGRADTQARIEAAKRELDFLKSLLPRTEPPQ